MSSDDPVIRGDQPLSAPTDPIEPPEEKAPPSVPVANPARVATVLYEPEKTFEEVRDRPDWLVPLLVLIALTLSFVFVVQPKINMEPYFQQLTRKIADRSGMTEEQRQQQLDTMMERSQSSRQKFMPVIFVPIVLIIVTLVLWGSMRMAGGNSSFMQTFSVTLYSWMPQAIKSLIVMVLVIPRSSIDMRFMGTILKSHPGAFVDPIASPVLSSALSWIEVFNIWTIVLLVIGLALTNRFSKAKVGVFVVSLYVILALLGIGLAVVQKSVMG